jgi:hypothetical protein
LWANIPALNLSLPFGLGMCLRRTVAKQYSDLCQRDAIRRSLDRAGHSLASCGDTDIGLLACMLGMGTATFPRLKIVHLIPEGRTSLQYMSRLLEGKAESQVVLSSLYELDRENLSSQRVQIRKLKYLFFWLLFVVSGFSVDFRLALSKMKGELQGYKRLRDLGLLR